MIAGFLLRRFRWVAAGWLVRTATRRGVERSIEAADAEVRAKIDAKVPSPVRSAADRLGVDVAELGGRLGAPAVVAHRQSRRVGGAAALTARTGRRAVGAPARLRGRMANGVVGARAQLDAEVDDAARRLRARAAGRSAGPVAATEALLDLRRRSGGQGPLPEVPEPVVPGRRRPRVEDHPPRARVQRSYRPPTRPWDRPLRRHDRSLPEGNSAQSGDQDR